MNFDFSDDQKFLKTEARKFLDAPLPGSASCAACWTIPAKSYDEGLWKAVAEQGWLGAAIPESLRRPGPGRHRALRHRRGARPRAGPHPLRLDRLFRRRGPHAGRLGGAEGQWLPKIAAGEVIGCFATVERPGALDRGPGPGQGGGRQAHRRQDPGHRRRRRRSGGRAGQGGRPARASSWSISTAPA